MTRFKDTIERLRNRISAIASRTGPSPFFSMQTALLVLSLAYGAVIRIRARLYEIGVLPSKTLPCRVVSVGNIVAGGTGKTPMTIFVAQLLHDIGCRVVVISRGYRGQMEASGGIVSDGKRIFKGPGEAGDEPYLMARVLKGIPVVVGKRRFESGMMAIEHFQPDVIVLDDAFQHMRLKRDLDLVLLDSRSPCGNGYVIPRGLLREPLSALRRAHAIIYTRSRHTDMPAIPGTFAERKPVFHSEHVPVIRKTAEGDDRFLTMLSDIAFLKGKRVVAFAGLADNDQFFAALKQAGCRLAHTVSFGDHHRYDGGDVDRIIATAESLEADVVVTTFKDFVKIETINNLPAALVVVDVAIELIEDEDRLRDTILAGISPQ